MGWYDLAGISYRSVGNRRNHGGIAVRDFIEGPIPAWFRHLSCKITRRLPLVDEASASLAPRADYYKEVELIQAELISCNKW